MVVALTAVVFSWDYPPRIAAASAVSPHGASDDPATPAATTGRQAASCDANKFRLAIDVGHTIEAPGATSARGVSEYVYNLRLAKLIEADLKTAGFANTDLMITNGVGRSQLKQRSARANAGRVDLFVSIHHDDVQPSYYRQWDYDGKAYHFSDKFAGYSIFVSYENRHKAESLDFSERLAAELMARGLHFTTHHAEDIPGERRQFLDPQRGIYRYDQLVVLKTTDAPAVLLEAAVIVNRDEEASLAERHAKIGDAVLQAIKQYCAEQQTKPARQLGP